jgi:hypothetical protein
MSVVTRRADSANGTAGRPLGGFCENVGDQRATLIRRVQSVVEGDELDAVAPEVVDEAREIVD